MMDYLKVYTDFMEELEPLTDDERGRLFWAMLLYAFNGSTPELTGNERFVWASARKSIDRTEATLEAKRNSGLKGGRPRKTEENLTKPNETETKQEEPKETPKDKEKEKDKDKEKRKKYGEYKNVLLTDEDLAKLKEEFPDYLQRIERLSEYLAKTGKAYKSHLAVIRSWARNDKPTKTNEGLDWMRQYLGGAT